MDRKFLYQNKIFKSRRKELRNEATETEQILWQFLKGSKLGFKFTRQYSAGPYILDFYCPKLRVGIELDGEQHKEKGSRLYDKDREKYLKAVNIKIIRFWNEDVVRDVNGVLGRILNYIQKISPPTA